uniref:Trihelix transcription factor ASIL2 n=1 Tax=Elaeis guineensis var. tenera TaxID=51953 RepID=A0A6I9RES7_ELAGV|nr:trihelix transcription factor ASIL2 [Elaeis guineensis]
MDDSQDDARYPPNHPYPSIRRRPFSSSSSSHQSKISAPQNSSFPRPIGRRYADEDDEDEQNDIDEAGDEDDEEEEDQDDGGRYRQIRDDDDDDDDDEDSSESRGKRRRLDRFALGFEFAPRVPRPAAAPPAGKIPAKSSPADWSEDATFVLLDAWGDRYVQNGRKSLRSDEWTEVAKKVSQSSRTTRSDAQCRNRLDTLKKKYKKEKVRMAEHASASSKWVYFKKMDELMSSPSPPAAGARQQQPPRLPCGVDAGEYVFASSSVYLDRSNGNDEMRDSPGDTGSEDAVDEEDDDESDGLPPTREKVSVRSSDSSFRMLADSIQKFGEIYEKMENSKRQQMAELERMRKEFQRDLEVHKRQILERAQAEIAKIREEEGEDEEEERSEDDEDGDDEIDVSAENLSG